jgi:phosphate transport system substrate-binding protein
VAALVAAFAISTPAKADDTKSGTASVDSALESYKGVPGVSGKITSKGSDTLANLMTFWAEGFKSYYPNVEFSVESAGSSTAPPALIEGTSDMGPMSRPMKEKEINDFQAKFGYKPSKVAVAIDALAVFVHKDNPVKELSLAQVDAMFGQNRKLGHTEDINKWGQVGLKGDWANSSISLYGRNSASGTYGYFKEHALGKGDYKNTVKEQPGSAAVVNGVGENRHAVGYSGIGYKNASVRAVPLSEKTGGKAFEATNENCYSGDYPLSRFLYIYFNRPQGKATDAKIREFFRYIHCKEGQEIVVKDGYIPLTKAVADDNAAAYK